MPDTVGPVPAKLAMTIWCASEKARFVCRDKIAPACVRDSTGRSAGEMATAEPQTMIHLGCGHPETIFFTD
jgi:hypothetical protein